MIVVVMAGSAFALSDKEYLRMKKSSAEFAEADEFLADAYSALKQVMSKSRFKTLQEEQREWIASGRDEEAEAFMNEGYSRIEAYTKATEERAEELDRQFKMYKLSKGE